MKKIYTQTLKQLAAATIIMAMVGCGADDQGDATSNAGQPAPEASQTEEQADELNREQLSTGTIQDGKYYLSSGTFEGSDADGNKIDRQTLQIAGDYYWQTELKGEEQYEVIATGSAKLSNSNTVLAELNCRGAQDVYSFNLAASGSMRNFAQLEAGCPQESQLNASQQMSVRSLNDDSFEYTVVSQSEGVRIVETYVFRK